MIVNYKKWLNYTGVTSFVACLMHLTLVYYIYKTQSHEILWVHNCLVKKETIARRIRGAKIVFAGGSATHFGIRTKDVQEKLGIHSVNMGLHAAIELDYLLERLKQILSPGDVVILPLEYEYLMYNGEPNDRTVDYIITYDKAFFKSLPFLEKLKYLINVTPLKLGQSLGTKLLFGKINEELGKGYNSSTLNENGDETWNVGNNRMDRLVASPVKIQTGEFLETTGLKILKDFNLWALRNHIAVYVTYANTLYWPQYQSDLYYIYFNKVEKFFSKNNIDTIGNPYDFFYSKELFYDTEYHLNQEGVSIRTRQLIIMITSLGIADKMRKH